MTNKNILCYSLTIFLTFTLFCNCSLNNKEENVNSGTIQEGTFIRYMNTGKTTIFKIFESIEIYAIKFHHFLQNEMQIEYPLDLIVFMGVGILLSWFLSLFNFKRKFIYNHQDQPDLSILINNVNS